jgi:hypothetical protein
MRNVKVCLIHAQITSWFVGCFEYIVQVGIGWVGVGLWRKLPCQGLQRNDDDNNKGDACGTIMCGDGLCVQMDYA